MTFNHRVDDDHIDEQRRLRLGLGPRVRLINLFEHLVDEPLFGAKDSVAKDSVAYVPRDRRPRDGTCADARAPMAGQGHVAARQADPALVLASHPPRESRLSVLREVVRNTAC